MGQGLGPTQTGLGRDTGSLGGLHGASPWDRGVTFPGSLSQPADSQENERRRRPERPASPWVAQRAALRAGSHRAPALSASQVFAVCVTHICGRSAAGRTVPF